MGNRYPPNLVRDFLEANPKGTYTDFVLKTGCKMVRSNYNYIRRKYRVKKATAPVIPAANQKSPAAPVKKAAVAPKKRSYVRRNSPVKIYSRLWVTSVEALLQDPKKALSDLISQMNLVGRSNLEIIELTNPHNIEVREATR